MTDVGLALLSKEQEIREDILKDTTNPLMRKILKLKKEDDINDPTHQHMYLRGLLGKDIGVFYKGEMTPFDVHSALIYPRLCELSRSDALDMFFQYYTIEGMIQRTLAFFNTALKEECEKKEYKMTTYLHNLGLKKEGCEWKDDDDIGTEKIIGVNLGGAVEILLKLALLKDLSSPQKSDLMDLEDSNPNSNKRKREDDGFSHHDEPAAKRQRINPNPEEY